MEKQTYPIPKAPERYTDLRGMWPWMPPHLLPYVQLLRLDRPTGYWLLVLPAWMSILIASERFDWQTLGLLLIFLIGAVALRGAGCVINDLWDRDFDRRVERTADRPLAAGAISGRRALGLFIILIGAGVLILMFLPWRVWGWALLSLPLIITYPLAKRFLPTPQVVLGLTFSWGALLGWLSVRPYFEAPTLWLYAGTFAWILYYDTIYATQDRADDQRMGLKSMPLFLGDTLHLGLIVFALSAFVLWALGLIAAGAGLLSWLGLLIIGGLIIRQLSSFDANDAAHCLKQFKANATLGQIWCLFLALDLVF